MNKKVITWLKRIGIIVLLFLLFKGLVWVAVILGIGNYIHSIVP